MLAMQVSILWGHTLAWQTRIGPPMVFDCFVFGIGLPPWRTSAGFVNRSLAKLREAGHGRP